MSRQKKGRWLLAGTVVCAGVMLGIMFALLGNGGADMSEYLGTISLGEENVRNSVFFDAIVKYGVFAFIIWVLGFARLFSVMSLAVAAVRGVSTGYGIGAAADALGGLGLKTWFALCFAQTAVLLPVYVFAAARCLEFGAEPFAERRKLPEYGLVLVVVMAGVVLAAVCEAYISPAVAVLILK